MEDTKILRIVKEHLDPGFSADDFIHWQELLNVIDPAQIKAGDKGFQIAYYRLLDNVLSGKFDGREDFMFELNKNENWIKGFKLWLGARKPKTEAFIENYMINKGELKEKILNKYSEYKKSKGEWNGDVEKKFEIIKTMDNKEIGMLSIQKVMGDMLDMEYNSPEIRRLFENIARNDVDVYKSYDQMIEAMGQNMLATKQVLLNGCMMAISGYYNSLKKRMEAGKEIPYYEMKQAYEMLKTELKEPTKIKEIRSKNMNISINMPLSEKQMAELFSKTQNIDLGIQIADNFKDLVNDGTTT